MLDMKRHVAAWFGKGAAILPCERIWRAPNLFTPPLNFPYHREQSDSRVDAWVAEDQWLAGLPGNRTEQFGWWQFPGFR
jgi:hypothetical protein